MERPPETCRVTFNKLEKIVHLVGFATEIYHDARSLERQIRQAYFIVPKHYLSLSLWNNKLKRAGVTSHSKVCDGDMPFFDALISEFYCAIFRSSSCFTIDTILYIKINVCLFVWNLYKTTFLNRSEPNFAHVSPLVWRRSEGMNGPTIF
jgi:hypothetical protein